MRIDAGTSIGGKVRVLDPNGQINGTVCACDTDEGWIECYVLRPASPTAGTKVLVDRKKREQFKVRVHTDFDVADRSGRKIFEVRWTLSGEPRPITKKFGPLPQ